MKNWMKYTRGEGHIFRLMTGKPETSGMVIKVKDMAEGRAAMERALKAGFHARGATGLLAFMPFSELANHRVEPLSRMLGASPVRITDEDYARITVDQRPAPAPEASPGPAPAAPAAEPAEAASAEDTAIPAPSIPAPPEEEMLDPSSFELLGVNSMGQEVFRDPDGRRWRRTMTMRGYEEESETSVSTDFMRARDLQDMHAIAAAVTVMAGRTGVSRDELAFVATNAVEGTDISPLEAMDALRQAVMRIIVDMSIEDDASLDSHHKAMALARRIGGAVTQRTEEGEPLNPSLPLLVTMRRLMRGHGRLGLQDTAPDMALAGPMAARGQNGFIVDMSGIDPGRRGDAAAAALRAREAEGATIFVLPSHVDAEDVDAIRNAVGRTHAIDGVLGMTDAVADGMAGTRSWSMIFVGAQRPEPLDYLPAAVLRSFPAVEFSDLHAFEREVLRARGRISQFNAGTAEVEKRIAEEREANAIQVPTINMSRKPSFTMTPHGLAGAYEVARQRVIRRMEPEGGVDSAVARYLGYSMEDMDMFSGEQVDAVAMAVTARDRGRSFLLADDAGVGKTLPMVAMARIHLRQATPERRKKIIYFTEKADLNIPDVLENFQKLGIMSDRVAILAARGEFEWTREDENGNEITSTVRNLSPARRKAIFESREFPEDYDIVVMNYSIASGKPITAVLDDKGNPTGEELGSPAAFWLRDAPDEDTLIIEDEAHNAINPKSNIGANIRMAEKAVGGTNVIKATATPTRDANSVWFYASLLPDEADADAILQAVVSGGEPALEAFATMMAMDGVFRRCNHDVANVDIDYVIPDDEKIAYNERIEEQFAEVIIAMIEANSVIREIVAQNRDAAAAEIAREMAQEGVNMALAENRNEAQRRARELNRYLGSPFISMSSIVEMMHFALKVDQVSEDMIAQFEEGKRPLMSFDLTFEGILDEMSRDETGQISEDAMLNARGLDLRDQARRVAERIFTVRENGQEVDLRGMHDQIDALAQELQARIDALPPFPVSPVDTIIRKLAERGIRMGEITGRKFRYDPVNEIIVRRSAEERTKENVVRQFADGDIEAVAYNRSGATGINLEDRERNLVKGVRVTNILQLMRDGVKTVQSAYRANRYRQLSRPGMRLHSTGLFSEMITLQQINRRLRSMGASTDGNRNHPLIIDDVPDLINRVGDEAMRNVLRANPDIARRMDLEHVLQEAPEGENEATMPDEDVDLGVGSDSIPNALANKVLFSLLVLKADEKRAFMRQVYAEYDALISISNPLKPKMQPGHIIMGPSTLYEGTENKSLDQASAFLAPVYLTTGVHVTEGKAYGGEQVIEEIERARRLHGLDTYRMNAERIRRDMADRLRAYLPTGHDIGEAMANPASVGGIFAMNHARQTTLCWLLENLRPGVGVNVPIASFDGSDAPRTWTVLETLPPDSTDVIRMPSAYRVRMIRPGDNMPVTFNLGTFMSGNGKADQVQFHEHLSRDFDERILTEFDAFATTEVREPVQVLHGNLLRCISLAAQNKLGAISLAHDSEGKLLRAVIVHDRNVDLSLLPVQVPTGKAVEYLARKHMEKAILSPQAAEEAEARRVEENKKRPRGQKIPPPHHTLRLWGEPEGKIVQSKDADFIIRFSDDRVVFDIPPFNKGNWDFYASRPGLFQALHGHPMPSRSDTKRSRKKVREAGEVAKSGTAVIVDIKTREDVERVIRALSILVNGKNLDNGKGIDFFAGSGVRDTINEFHAGATCDWVPTWLPERNTDGRTFLPDVVADAVRGPENSEDAEIEDDLEIEDDQPEIQWSEADDEGIRWAV